MTVSSWIITKEPLTTCAWRQLPQIAFVRYRDTSVSYMEMPTICTDTVWNRMPAFSARRLDLSVRLLRYAENDKIASICDVKMMKIL